MPPAPEVKLWKCFHCPGEPGKPPGRDFEGDHPVCPGCGLDARKPGEAGAIAKREAVHLALTHAVLRLKGTGELACGAAMNGRPATSHPDAVTCGACRRADAYAAARDFFGLDAETL